MQTTAVATNKRVADMLSHEHKVPPEIVEGLINHAGKLQEWIGQIAVKDGFLSYEDLAMILARETNLPLVNLHGVSPDQRALEHLPASDCRKHGVVPLAMQQGKLVLAMANPLDEVSLQLLNTAAQCELVIQIAPLNAIQHAVEAWYADLSSRPPAGDMGELQKLLADLHAPNNVEASGFVAGDGADMLCLDDLLQMMAQQGASDLHLAAGSPPSMRLNGRLQSMPFPVLTARAIQAIVYTILTDIQITSFERNRELDFSYSMPGLSRFRVNLHRQRGSVGAVFRVIPVEVPSLDKLHMPPIVREFTLKPRGLVLITGPTGSGKSTTLAAMIDEINRTAPAHIVTIEDPIEFLHNNQLSIVTQREVGPDTDNFATALRHVLRQDPDVILIGEMRDLETISAALTAAETGHLVFATLHTTSAAQTIDRIVDAFPDTQQDQVRAQLANVLEGVLTQTLLQRLDGKGRICAQEIMVATPAIRTLIRDNKVHQMTSIIQASAKYGMQTLDTALRNLVLSRQVSFEEALRKTPNADDFKAMVTMH